MALIFKDEVTQTLISAHREWNLPLEFLRAIVWVESAGQPNAMRYEPGYRYLYNVRESIPVVVRPEDAPGPQGFAGPGAISKWTEYTGQKTSWGLMQIMGAVAREYGFRGYFPGLCAVQLNVHYGCKHLDTLGRRWRAKDDLVALATSYNTGSPKDEAHPYWQKVTQTMARDV